MRDVLGEIRSGIALRSRYSETGDSHWASKEACGTTLMMARKNNRSWQASGAFD